MEKNKETRMVDEINMVVQVPDDFLDKYRNAVIKSDESCSVTKHLEKPPRIDIYVKNGS